MSSFHSFNGKCFVLIPLNTIMEWLSMIDISSRIFPLKNGSHRSHSIKIKRALSSISFLFSKFSDSTSTWIFCWWRKECNVSNSFRLVEIPWKLRCLVSWVSSFMEVDFVPNFDATVFSWFFERAKWKQLSTKSYTKGGWIPCLPLAFQLYFIISKNRFTMQNNNFP